MQVQVVGNVGPVDAGGRLKTALRRDVCECEVKCSEQREVSGGSSVCCTRMRGGVDSAMQELCPRRSAQYLGT